MVQYYCHLLLASSCRPVAPKVVVGERIRNTLKLFANLAFEYFVGLCGRLLYFYLVFSLIESLIESLQRTPIDRNLKISWQLFKTEILNSVKNLQKPHYLGIESAAR